MNTTQEFATLLFEQKGGVAYITVNRPQQLNALNRQAIVDLSEAFAAVREDVDIHGVILTGAGDRAFAAGADISELAAATPMQAAVLTRAGQDLFNVIENLGKPVIAVVGGLALGGGCELAMSCTLRLAADTARFGQPEVKLGVIPGYGGTQRLQRLVGKGRALQMILTGATIDAEEAYRIGLVNEVLSAEKILPRAETLLASITANAPFAVRSALQAINRGADTSVAEGLELEGALFALCTSTSDFREGTSAFLEKRRAQFQGT